VGSGVRTIRQTSPFSYSNALTLSCVNDKKQATLKCFWSENTLDLTTNSARTGLSEGEAFLIPHKIEASCRFKVCKS
jgi:hypothetical protein